MTKDYSATLIINSVSLPVIRCIICWIDIFFNSVLWTYVFIFEKLNHFHYILNSDAEYVANTVLQILYLFRQCVIFYWNLFIACDSVCNFLNVTGFRRMAV